MQLLTCNDVIVLARAHVADKPENESSARLCLADAVALYDLGDFVYARARALRSLAYSCGILHSDYIKAAE